MPVSVTKSAELSRSRIDALKLRLKLPLKFEITYTAKRQRVWRK